MLQRFSSVLDKILLVVLFAYIFIGNAARVLAIPGFHDNIAITEFLLYLFAFLSLACSSKGLPLWLIVISGFVIVAFFIGVAQFDFAVSPAIYALRLLFMLFTALSLSRVFRRFWGTDYARLIFFFAWAYLILAMEGFILYFAFPNSRLLWAFLARHGISYHGDPHQQRFYSLVFDPNFYSAIMVLGVIISFVASRIKNSWFWLAAACLEIVTILLSKSRSGAVALVFVLILSGCIAFIRYSFDPKPIKISNILKIAFVMFLAGLLMLFKPEIILPVVQRILTTSSIDGSTVARYQSLARGFSLISDHLWGIGYNFYPVMFAHEQSSLDSSLLMLAATLGVVPILFLSAACIWSFVSLKRKVSDLPSRNILRRFSEYTINYCLVSILWTSTFNNLLVYQFWLIPVMSIMLYLHNINDNTAKSQEMESYAAGN